MSGGPEGELSVGGYAPEAVQNFLGLDSADEVLQVAIDRYGEEKH